MSLYLKPCRRCRWRYGCADKDRIIKAARPATHGQIRLASARVRCQRYRAGLDPGAQVRLVMHEDGIESRFLDFTSTGCNPAEMRRNLFSQRAAIWWAWAQPREQFGGTVIRWKREKILVWLDNHDSGIVQDLQSAQVKTRTPEGGLLIRDRGYFARDEDTVRRIVKVYPDCLWTTGRRLAVCDCCGKPFHVGAPEGAWDCRVNCDQAALVWTWNDDKGIPDACKGWPDLSEILLKGANQWNQ